MALDRDCAVMLTKIEPIAIYAAVLSTIVFIWTFLYCFGPAPGSRCQRRQI
jgi:hypothetical protein